MNESTNELKKTVQVLAAISHLSLKAFKAPSQQALIFIILNDTVPIIGYNRAVLWKLSKHKKPPQLLGISGQAKVTANTELSRRWQDIIQAITNPKKPQLINDPDLPTTTSILWIPIFTHEKLELGLWLERWNNNPWQQQEIDILNFLIQNYGAAWEKFSKKITLKTFTKKPILIGIGIAVFLLMFLRVPLRVVAPCEIVPKDPIVITAPLEGIIEKIIVQPGDTVKKGELLFYYDKRVPLQELRVAQKKVDIINSEVNRATAQAQKDKKALSELAIAALKLKKEQLELELAEYRASQLDVESPINGVALIDDPEEWHGKPVKIGEKVLIIANPEETKIRMWVPEDDNINLKPNIPIKIFLNVNPETSEEAHLTYIANYTLVSEKSVTSFIAEAEWVGHPKDIKLGLKGSAILYGENVSLFYWIVRKPWAYFRRFIGM